KFHAPTAQLGVDYIHDHICKTIPNDSTHMVRGTSGVQQRGIRATLTFYIGVEDAVMQRAYRLHKRVEHDPTPDAKRKRNLTEQMLARATGKPKRKVI
ncbi:MAG: hypothetical protein P4L57_14900, partial [Rhizomicrobium sp.]|nr:hypothetical protein [Rhizomicrobium sp.]